MWLRKSISVPCFRKCGLMLLLMFCVATTSCTSIGRLISTPNYSHHAVDKILLDEIENNKRYSVFIKSTNGNGNYNDNACSIDNGCYLNSKTNIQIENLFANANVNIVDKPENADYIIGVDVKNVVDDVDIDYAKKMRNAFLQYGAIGDYMFDKNNNNPYIYTSQKFDIAQDGQNSGILVSRRKSILPSVLYTFTGAGAGFIAGYFLGSVSPIAIGFAGALIVGGLTYAIYSAFKDVGVVVVYDVKKKKKLSQQVKNSRKVVVKISGNISEEHYYTLDNDREKYISHNAIIAIGSRAIKKDMLLRISTMIANNVADTFGLKR